MCNCHYKLLDWDGNQGCLPSIATNPFIDNDKTTHARREAVYQRIKQTRELVAMEPRNSRPAGASDLG